MLNFGSTLCYFRNIISAKSPEDLVTSAFFSAQVIVFPSNKCLQNNGKGSVLKIFYDFVLRKINSCQI